MRRLRELRRTTPGRLRLIRAFLVTLTLLTGLFAGITAASARAGTDDLADRAQPLLIEAETVWSALADADTTAAQAFLAGGLEPAAMTSRYEQDLDRAAAALTSAARRTPEDSAAGQAVQQLSTGLTQYSALVASARANNRQGLPVGASYLSTASELNRTTLQPQAEDLLRAAQSEVDHGYSAARSSGWTTVLTLLLLGLLLALVATQIHLSRITRRTFNVRLLAATGVAAVLGLSVLAAVGAQRGHLSDADDEGSRPVAMLAQARTLALNERSYESLTLVARAGDDTNQRDFGRASAELTTLLDQIADEVAGTRAEKPVRAALQQHKAYLGVHEKVRQLDKSGDYAGAVKLAVGTDATKTFEGMTDNLGAALENRKDVFGQESGVAGRGLGSLSVAGPLLALVVCGLAVAGLRARLEEYR
ncbi:hypothetical protein [Actinoplanes sp. N902-109]|uniref:hypothetical protein n=1 Tax=Actinoplanes sp. (strain N902-109) TaxID=649831 RepID=UPI00032952C3|nr:hypothetical protein [Actinoplanes sp. N902-109]AGL18547.1 putative secreted protein [Actinoplanes sp. N902-109]